MTDPEAPVHVEHLTPAALLKVAVAGGLLAGLVEVVIGLAQQLLGGRLSLFGAEFAWLAPVASGVVFLLVGGLYAALGVAIRPLRRAGVAVSVLWGLGAISALAAIDRLHWAAGVVLGLGLGRAAARWGAVPRLAGRIVLGGALVAVGAAGAQAGWDRLRERQSVAGAAAGADHPNILLLVLDTVRAWNLGWYGYQRPTTPLLDRRWDGGVIFDRVLATAPWTLPSHASMFTGHHPSDLSAGWDRPLDGRYPTVAEVLQRAGYATGGFVGNYRYAGAATGLARGFGRYEDYPRSPAEAIRMLGLPRRALRVPAVQQWLGERRILEAKLASEVNRDFLGWVDRHPDRPFFAFLNYIDGHSPYLPPAPFDSLWTRRDSVQISRRYVMGVERVFGPGPIPRQLLADYLDGYDGAMSYLDGQIDSLLGELARRGRLDNTIVVLTADHGEHFGEHGLIQHGNSLYLPLLHVPLVVWGPGKVPAGLRIGAPTSLRHLAATLLDLARVPDPRVPGRSLAAHWGADSLDTPPDTVLSAVEWHRTLSKFPPSPLLGGSLRAILVDSLHYIRRTDGVEELYDLSRDFLESRNLVGDPTARPALLEARRQLEAALGKR